MGRAVTPPAEAEGAAPGRGRLAGRRVLVVGAGTRPSPEPDPPLGNGRAISVLAAREGAAVACADRNAAAAEATAALVRAEHAEGPGNGGQSAAVVLADVAAADACASVVADSAAALGGLDGLVLNVGIGLGRGMAGTSVAQWDQTFAVNTRAHFLVAAAALEALEPGSAIVFISSAASLRTATGIPAYDASKAALLGICRQVAREGMAGDGLGGGLRHGVAAVRRIQLRQRAPADPRRRRDQLRLTAGTPRRRRRSRVPSGTSSGIQPPRRATEINDVCIHDAAWPAGHHLAGGGSGNFAAMAPGVIRRGWWRRTRADKTCVAWEGFST